MKNGIIFILCLLLFAAAAQAADEQLIGARFPALSPDGEKIAFSYMGDLWVVASAGGKAARLTNHAAYDREPVWSPDGRWIAFTSNRMGNNDIFIIPSGGGDVRQITFHSGSDIATDFSPDGQWIYFTSGRASSSSIYKIKIDGSDGASGNALPVLETYWNRSYDAKVGPGGRSVLFSLGMENGSKWRKGYHGANSAKIWLKEFDRDEAKLLVSGESNAFWPCWSADGGRIYFISDRDAGCKNIWSAANDGSGIRSVTRFRENDVKWFKTARNVPKAVYERDFGIWITDLNTGESHAVRIDAPAETKENRTFFVTDGQVSEFRLSPDGKKIAAVVRGEIFVTSTEGGYARNITNSSCRERSIIWDKDSRSIIYVSDKDAQPDLYVVSALGNEEPRRLTRTDGDIQSPALSPDGKLIAYFSGARQLRVMQPDGANDRLVIEDDFGGRFGDDCVWAPDSRYIAVVTNGANQDIFAVSVETGEKTALTNTAYDEASPVWAPDGKKLFFSSNRFGHSFPEFTGKWDIYCVHFEPVTPAFKEDEFEKLFVEKRDEKKGAAKEEQKKEEKPPVDVSFKLDNIDLQTDRVANTLTSERTAVVSPKDPNTVYIVSNWRGSSQLWTSTYKDGRWGELESFVPAVTNPGNLQFDAEGKYLYYSSRGKIGRINMSSKRSNAITFSTKIEVDKTADYEEALAEAYYILQYYYYDANHHDADWKKVYERFRPVLKQVREDNDFSDYANEMIGYLNSSHTGYRGGSRRSTEKPSPHFGALWDFSANPITIARILKNGPLYLHRDSVAVGDELVSVDGEPLDAGQNIWKALNGKMNRRVRMTIKSRSAGKNMRLSLKAISNGAEKNLIKEEWIESRRETVRKMTGDKAAYIYMSAMGRGDLNRFLKELERDAVPRKGLILDIRYNMGGNVHDRVLQALTTPVYAMWRQRGLSETQQSTFGFADKPVILLTNEVTLSDGEMTANGFRSLDRGTIVGNTTYGWLIFTTSARLINGNSIRLPWWGCYTLDGQDLETIGGVKPDILVINDLNDDLFRRDPQLDRAIQEIMKKIR